jgi:hypothetical protein
MGKDKGRGSGSCRGKAAFKHVIKVVKKFSSNLFDFNNFLSKF